MVYVHIFTDINNERAEILSKVELTDIEWSIKENEYNIILLKMIIKYKGVRR